MENKTFRDVFGYAGLYTANELGVIKSNIKTKNQRTQNNGYLIIDLYKENKQKTVLVHRIIAQTFISNSENKPCVNHINGIKTDNRAKNLEWCTYSENQLHAVKTGLRRTKKIFQHDLNGKLLNTFNSLKSAAKETGTHNSRISECCNGKQKTSNGFKWSSL